MEIAYKIQDLELAINKTTKEILNIFIDLNQMEITLNMVDGVMMQILFIIHIQIKQNQIK